MRLPINMPARPIEGGHGAGYARALFGAVEPQGCNAFEWAQCAAVIAACAASGAGVAACVAAAAPSCLKCV